MKKDPNEGGRISEHAHGLGTPTLEMVRARARELAQINGRSPHQVLESDMEEAWRELTGRNQGEAAEDPDQVVSTAQWEPVPSDSGRRVESTAADDEQTENEKLTEEGIEDAEHDQMVEGTRDSLRRGLPDR